MSWKPVSRSSAGPCIGATVLVEINNDEGLYRVSLDGEVKAVSDNQREARAVLADRLAAVAAELRR